jgi:tRNA 5-methylaminomethyl-2-thiouridine biosynthesis bifunctional protein
VATGATCILDTAFGAGAGFLRAWQDYADALPRTAQLHYVGLIELGHWPLDFSAIAQATSAESGEHAQALTQALRALSIAQGPAPGFYRLPFDQGRVLLTLCLGTRDTSLASC